MALKAGYVGVKKNDATKLSQLPGITEIGTGLELEDGELSATGATKTIEANPEGSATTDLTKLQIGTTIYGVSNVKANPSGTATTDLTKLTVNNTIYSIPGSDNSKCYQTDDETESAIVDADYIPFLDSSAASGAGAPRKSTWSNFCNKIAQKIPIVKTASHTYSALANADSSLYYQPLDVTDVYTTYDIPNTSKIIGLIITDWAAVRVQNVFINNSKLILRFEEGQTFNGGIVTVQIAYI